MTKKSFKVTTNIPYQVPDVEQSDLELFDQTNPDIGLFNLIDDEVIRLSGSKILYFKFNKSGSYDEIYMEQRDKVMNIAPVVVFGHYEPTVVERDLTEFGIVAKNDQIFIFNKSYIERRLGREPITGDIVKPVFQDIRYKIIEVQEDSFESYGVYHYVCAAQILRDSATVNRIKQTEKTSPIGRAINPNDLPK